METTVGQQLAGHKYLNLETFRRNGQGVPTPVWFAIDEATGEVYVRTFTKMGKVRRVRRESHGRVVPCDARGTAEGPWTDAEARIVAAESEEAAAANRLLNRKYGLVKRALEPVVRLKYGPIVTIALRIQGSPE